MSKNVSPYEAAIEMAKTKFTDGEEYQGILYGIQKTNAFLGFLQRYLFGWLINILIPSPRTYGVAYSQNMLVILGYKKTKFTTSFEPEFAFARKCGEFKITKSLGSYLLTCQDDNGKKLRVGIQATKQDKEALARLVSISAS